MVSSNTHSWPHCKVLTPEQTYGLQPPSPCAVFLCTACRLPRCPAHLSSSAAATAVTARLTTPVMMEAAVGEDSPADLNTWHSPQRTRGESEAAWLEQPGDPNTPA